MAVAITEAEARSIMRVLGKAKGGVRCIDGVSHLVDHSRGRRQYRACNGTAFALDTGERLFSVTAKHVFGRLARRSLFKACRCAPNRRPSEGRNAIIAAHADIDICTFEISPEEVRQLGKTALRGYQTLSARKADGNGTANISQIRGQQRSGRILVRRERPRNVADPHSR
jgi:hypothetical protein